MPNKKIQSNTNKILNIILDCILFIGALMTISMLVILMFSTESTTIAIISGLGAMNALFTYDMYKKSRK
jgi:uncharacterized membrane-anchored protein